jgi:1,2-diacylglycerol 3-alpha-glucosyltransferase
LNICIFSDTYSPQVNGVVTSIITLKEGLEAQGHNVYIVTVNNEKLKTTITDEVIRVSAVKLKKFDGHCIATILNSRAMKQLKKWNIDIVHTHTEFVIGTTGRIFARREKLPLVHTYHTLYEDYVHYVTNGFFDKQARVIARHLTKHICNYSKEVIVPTPKISHLLKKYRVKSNLYTLPTGVDLKKFFPDNFTQFELDEFKSGLGFKDDEFIITYIGRLAKEKEIDKIIKAFAKVSSDLNKTKLVIVGDGPAREQLEELTSELNVERVEFLGRVPWDQIPIYYNISDVFVTASKSETQGLTVFEALAASTPVFCVDDPSFDIVVDGFNGRKFDSDDELAECFKEAYLDRNQLSFYASNAFESVQELDIEIFVSNAVKIYNRVITNHRRRLDIKTMKKRFWRLNNEK